MEDLTEQSNEIQEIMGRSYDMPDIDDEVGITIVVEVVWS